ncbi:GLT25-like protein [Mya arenaria]|uniref:GLT25-like protein n=1 Tax=Mya arenaria TaxID=6604 RepID=A0ABY7GBH1_MYAAR|nr:GLT25-like protein [Mya arenaria]
MGTHVYWTLLGQSYGNARVLDIIGSVLWERTCTGHYWVSLMGTHVYWTLLGPSYGNARVLDIIGSVLWERTCTGHYLVSLMGTHVYWTLLETLNFITLLPGSVAYGEKNSLLANSNKEREEFLPTVMVATLVRNKAYALPYFFGLLEKLYSDHNVDNSTEVIKEWVAAMENQYNSIEFIYDDTKEGYRGEKSPCDWTLGRFQHVLTVREKALEAARLMWADYILMIDADVMIENPLMLRRLIEEKQCRQPRNGARVEGRGLIPSPHISMRSEAKDRLGFDKVYMVNLERRSERRTRMMHVFDVLGIEAEWVPAVDGKPMTMGEIGCFLSHYFIWKDMLEKGYKDVVVFEDDLRFEPYFRSKLNHIMKLVKHTVPDWDLIYLGRKRLNRKDERFVEGTDNIVWPSYSYWTLSYLLSAQGAKKLLAQMPLQNLLPVDEYLPSCSRIETLLGQNQ